MPDSWSWQEAQETLSCRDPILASLFDLYPQERLTRVSTAFASLAKAVVAQQISTKAAEAIWGRILLQVKDVLPENFLALSLEAFVRLGLSRRKAQYLLGLAQYFARHGDAPWRWETLEDEEVRKELQALKGIGPWTVDMFLIFYLLRPNILPMKDLGIQKAAESLYGKGQLLRLKELWSPWCTVAAWTLWRHLDPVAVRY